MSLDEILGARSPSQIADTFAGFRKPSGKETMVYPDWTPASIVQLVKNYQEFLCTDHNLERAVREVTQFKAEMWSRLATRPEMEPVWRFISGLGNDQWLVTNGGLSGKLNRAVDYYNFSPLLTAENYKNELLEIAELAQKLSNKLTKFCDAESGQNPFTYLSLLDSEQLDRANKMMRPELFKDRSSLLRFNTGFFLDYHLPPLNTQLKQLADCAKTESKDQTHRLRLPRKVNSKNAFRTYYVRHVSDYFFTQCADYSPSRIAIFCSVALDDPEITPDLVGKTCPPDDAQKAMLKANKKYREPED